MLYNLTRPDAFYVESQHHVTNGVDHHHETTIKHGKVVIWPRALEER